MKKIGILCLALVLALGSLGMGYAAWSETLTISGTVATGTVDAVFEDAVSNDAGTLEDPNIAGTWALGAVGVPEWTGTRYDKHAGVTTATIHPDDPKTLIIAITNAYPSYWGSVGLTIKNTGTIPVQVADVVVTITAPAGGAVGDLEVVLAGALVAADHVQIHPGAEALGAISFHVKGTALEARTYAVTVTIVVTQFNLVP